MKKRLAIFTFDDLSCSQGPSVHFLESWNAFALLPQRDIEIFAWSASWLKAKPIIEPLFPLKCMRVPQNKLLRYLLSDFFFALIMIRYRRDLVYIRLSAYSFFMIVVAAVFRIHLIVELNGIIAKDTALSRKSFFNKEFSNRQEKMLIRMAEVCIAVTPEIAKHAQELGCRQTAVIENGVSEKYFSLPQHLTAKMQIVYVGTFTLRDGAADIVALAKYFPDCSFHLIGDGVTRKSLQKKATKNVHFYGMLPYAQLCGYYANFDAGIVLYQHDIGDIGTSSLKTREYLACGLPVFTTAISGQHFIREHALGVAAAAGQLEESFQYFLDHFADWKLNVEHYRFHQRLGMSWHNTASRCFDLLNTFGTDQYSK